MSKVVQDSLGVLSIDQGNGHIPQDSLGALLLIKVMGVFLKGSLGVLAIEQDLTSRWAPCYFSGMDRLHGLNIV